MNNNDKDPHGMPPSSGSRSRSGSELTASTSNVEETTSLRARLSRHPSTNSISEKTKMKLKLQLSQAGGYQMTTPLLLSPRGTPNQSPEYNKDGFFNNFETQLHTNKSHLDTLLDEGNEPQDSNVTPEPPIPIIHTENDSHPVLKNNSNNSNNISNNNSNNNNNNNNNNASSSIKQSKTKPNLYPLQTKIRMPSSSSSNPQSGTPSSVSASQTPRSPLNKYKSRNIAYQALPEPVRPQTSILKSNFNTKFSQQYQQQEKKYLTGITKYRNRYKNVDDYYDKSVVPDDVTESVGSTSELSDISKFTSVDSEIEDNSDYLGDKNREYEALKALGQQIGSELLDKELKSLSEYSLDSNLLLDLLNQNDEIQLKNTNDNQTISERLEWQTMLQTVMTGDVVKGEKTKLIKPLTELEGGENLLRVGYKEDFWLGLRAKLYGRTEEEQKKLVLYHRGLVDEKFDEILNFKLEFTPEQLDMSYKDKVKFASVKVNHLLDIYEKCKELWRTEKEMETDKPQCATPEFINRINCLNAWTSVTDAIERESDVLKKWVGNDDLDILRPSLSSANTHDSTTEGSGERNSQRGHIFKDDRPFVERIMKEKDIENLFNKKLFNTFSHLTIKAKNAYLEYHQIFKELGLPSYLDNLFVLTNFSSKLMKEIIRTRLAYAEKLKNPTMMMIDQILEDLKMYLRLAIEIKISMLEYCAPVEGWVSFPDYQDTEFDNTIIDCVTHYMDLLNRKLLFSPKGHKSFRTFKEPEELESEWTLLRNLGFYINGISVDFSSQISSLFVKLITRLYTFVQNQIQGPPSDGYRLDSQRLIRWYTSTLENLGQLRRKFIRFEVHLFQYFQNSVSFKLIPHKAQRFFTLLKESNHALYQNQKIAEDGVYIFVSESLVYRPYDVECILRNKYLGVNFNEIPKRHVEVIEKYHPTIQFYVSREDDENETTAGHENGHDDKQSLNMDYVIVVVPPKALMWDGIIVPFNDIDSLLINELRRGNAMFMTAGSPNDNVSEIFSVFKQFVGDTIGTSTNICCSVPKIESNIQASLKVFNRITCLTIDCTPTIRNQCRGVGNCQELVNNIFIFARDIGRDSIRNSGYNFNLRSGRGPIILRLIKLAIEWLSFIVDDCSPTDPKTFRWCVSALEFAMDITRGFNILILDSEKFYRLKDKVAGCMSLLISHFDIMGARAKELQRTRMQKYGFETQKDIYTLDDESLGSLRAHIMYQIKQIEENRRKLQVEQRSVGRVLDDTDMENQLLTYLASSFSSVSIRWQKGKFLGGGTFGSVYASVNLDTGGPMAVKEIRFQDRQSIKTVVPAIKGEMSVLELLSHPNIVQFFGVEVHRDRVYIFMEYCSGGSLASLLEYGRIEDEIVIQLYTLQMLEALAYLHQFGIVHRDVKPDNILLDHMGVIKFVDFGSAKVIAIPSTGTTPATTATSGSTNTNAEEVGTAPPSNTNSANNTISEYMGSTTSTMSSTMSMQDGSDKSYISSQLHMTSSSQSDLNVAMTNSSAVIESLMESKKSHALTGTPMYMSPETIKGEKTGRFGAMDIWSLGCCIIEMATGRRPWSNLDNEFAVMYHIAAGHLPQFPNANELSEQGREFLAKCMVIDPTKRASAVELLQDPWIMSIRNEAFSEE